MNERSTELERAGALMQGHWDAQRIERTLQSAKHRRVRRLATRAALATSGAGIVLFLALRTAPETMPVATQAVPPAVLEHAPFSPDTANPQARAPVAVVQPQAEPREAAQDDAGVRGRRSRVQLASTSTSKQQSDWRVRMRKGDVRGAYAILRAEQPSLSTLDDLMLAADAARRAGDAPAAVVYLEQALRDHSGPRSAVVAFTLGRILRDELHQPGPAAQAFMKVQASQDAPLVADALAREVEAWEAAGSRERAKQRAKLYVQRYPSGERRAWMDRLLQAP